MATYVLVHGGGHGGLVLPARRAAACGRGSRGVTRRRSPGLGERAHLAVGRRSTSTLHIDDVVAVLLYEDLRDVILVGHSYGGMVITGVADRAPERIGDLVYLDAANAEERPVTRRRRGPDDARRPHVQGRVVDGIELVLFPDDRTRSATTASPIPTTPHG